MYSIINQLRICDNFSDRYLIIILKSLHKRWKKHEESTVQWATERSHATAGQYCDCVCLQRSHDAMLSLKCRWEQFLCTLLLVNDSKAAEQPFNLPLILLCVSEDERVKAEKARGPEFRSSTVASDFVSMATTPSVWRWSLQAADKWERQRR